MLSTFSSNNRGAEAETLTANLFQAHGWQVDSPHGLDAFSPDLIVRMGAQCYAIQVKALAEGRPDRVIPMLSQAILQAQAQARSLGAGKAKPLAVISVENASRSLSRQVALFVKNYAPAVAVGLISNNGLRYFIGAGLEDLNAEPEEPRWYGTAPSAQPANLFSDLNQWLLKVLLAPEIPEHLLQAPRQQYRSGAELAEAAEVSAMSVSRFLQQLRNEGYLDESSRNIALVRRQELFRRWRSAAMRPAPELPMRFLIRGNTQKQIRGLVESIQGESCLALFLAAEALGLGHVSGVPSYIYVPKLPRPKDKNWRLLTPASEIDMPDLIVRQTLTPRSVFQGAVHQGELIVSDIIQVWLDVVNHPSRGEEQADLIYEKALRSIVAN